MNIQVDSANSGANGETVKMTTRTRSWTVGDLFWGSVGLLFWLTGLRSWVLRQLQSKRQVLISCLDYFVEVCAGDVKKRKRLSPRSISMARPGDLVIVFEPLSMAFMRYLRETHGIDLISWPKILLGEHGGDLLRSIRTDEALVAKLRQHGGVLEPLIQRRGLLDLAEPNGLHLPRTSQRLLRNDDVLRRLNHKRRFQEACHWLGIPVPTSEWHRGKNFVLDAALRLLRTYPELRLRKAVSAGGLAVVALKRPDHGGIWRQHDLEAQIPAVDWTIWNDDDVAVEPFLPVTHPFSVVFLVTSVGPVVVDTCDRIVFNGAESGGGLCPSDLSPRVLRRAVRMTMRFGWWLWRQGYRGLADMDLGLMEGGGLVAFEANVRKPATMTQIALRENHAGGKGAALGRDFIRVGAETTLDDALYFLSKAQIRVHRQDYTGIGWDPKRGWGVFITLEPKHGSMAYSVVAPTRVLATLLDEMVTTWAAEQARNSAPPVAAHG